MLIPWRLCLGIISAARSVLADGDTSATTTSLTGSQVSSAGPDAALANASTSTVAGLRTGTCPSRTINYVTQTLPQQCLRTDRSRARNDGTSTGVAVVSSISKDDIKDLSGLGSDDRQNVEASTTYTSASESSPSPAPDLSVESDHGSDTDQGSPLDTAHFLSFDDWKKQNLAKAGQSADSLGPRAPIEPGRKLPVNNVLASLGDENEINIDFAGFGGVASTSETTEFNIRAPASTNGADVIETSPASQALRPRDAGRTCKERTNYASFDCAATVLKTNPECKSASSVLVENKDSYMLNKCSAKNKYVIIELCNDILIDTVVLANYEFFSSIFRQFRLSVSDRYPVKAEKWKDLGSYEARNTREVQAFLVENPLIWARYLRIEFLSHYGSEYYCPLSLLRVHGTTMMEEFRNQEELSRGEIEGQDDGISTGESGKIVHIEDVGIAPLSEEAQRHDASKDDRTAEFRQNKPAVIVASVASYSYGASTSAAVPMLWAIESMCRSGGENDSGQGTGTATDSVYPRETTDTSSRAIAATGTANATGKAPGTVSPSTSTSQSSKKLNDTNDRTTPSTPVTSVSRNSSQAISPTSLLANPAQIVTNSTLSSVETSSTAQASGNSTIKTISSTTTLQVPQPTTQESFFKSISKRLQQLESNSTLGMQYIEEQSRILRDAFNKVEKRQINMTTTFLANLNMTVISELIGFRQAYDQLWQSTVIELEGQREQHTREMTALSSRLTLAVDELVWQKRMGIVQSTLLLLCLALVLFGRNASEASIVQQVMFRSGAAFRSGAGSEANSPAGSRSPVHVLRRKLWKKEAGSDNEPPSALASAEASPGLQAEFDVPLITHTEFGDQDDDVLSDAGSFNEAEEGYEGAGQQT